jgi:hypothetical protein
MKTIRRLWRWWNGYSVWSETPKALYIAPIPGMRQRIAGRLRRRKGLDDSWEDMGWIEE